MEEQNRIEDRMEEMETEERGTKQAREWLETDPEAEGEAEGMDRKTMKYKRNKDNPRTGKDMRNQDSGKSGRFRLTGCLGAKIVAFFLLALSGIIGFWGLIGCVHMAESGFYEGSLTDVLGRELQSPSSTAMFEVVGYIEQGDIMEAKAYCRERNVGVELIQEDAEGKERVVWSTWDGDDTKYMTEMYLRLQMQQDNVSVDGGRLWDDEEYLVRAHVDSSFPIEDNFRRLAEMVTRVYDARFVLIGVTAAAIFLCILLFVFLMCGAGHQNGREGIVPGVLAAIPLDVLTLVFGFGAVLVGFAGLNVVWNLSTVTEMVALSLMGSLLAVWGTMYCMEVAVRLKRGKCFRYSVTYWVLRGCFRACRFLGRGFLSLLRDLPLVLTVVAAYLGLCMLELIILIMASRAGEMASVLWLMEKAALFVVVVYVALACRKLLKAGEALAEGQGDYKVDTSRLVWGFKEHGEDLNSLGQGISRAVAERMRSERLKTELITNVSHDLKTPMTSIINYADLIWEEAAGGGMHGAGMNNVHRGSREDGIGSIGTVEEGSVDAENGKACGREGQDSQGAGAEEQHGKAVDGHVPDMSRVTEYAEVLLRQSRRLKKLLEDLLEASKATTGNLEVNLEPCEVGVLLSQAVGEYQQRMEEKRLNLIVRQPEETDRIMADGRHLWRVFDNLLNNICKYAQEDSRVYLSVEEREGDVTIIFRNMSKYPLDISTEELEERFVRGDKSRHMEGNGLGLSIAKSLVELQGGRMEITIDGDLFKVTLRFGAI